MVDEAEFRSPMYSAYASVYFATFGPVYIVLLVSFNRFADSISQL